MRDLTVNPLKPAWRRSPGIKSFAKQQAAARELFPCGGCFTSQALQVCGREIVFQIVPRQIGIEDGIDVLRHRALLFAGRHRRTLGTLSLHGSSPRQTVCPEEWTIIRDSGCRKEPQVRFAGLRLFEIG